MLQFLLTNRWAQLLVTAALSLAVGWGYGRWSAPTKTVTVKESTTLDTTKSTDKTNDKKNTVKDKDENVNKKQQIHIVETLFPDGTKKTETFILNEDTVVIKERVTDTSETTTDKSNEHTNQTTDKDNVFVETKKDNWQVSLMAGVDYSKMSLDRDVSEYSFYGAEVSKYVLGPVFLGAFGTTAKQVGFTAGIKF